jgi:2-amino-4-hydroxy-6-hydroxymethyldihydropteridine diphosphokinase
MSERRHCAYLSLGSNIRPEQNLPAAVRELARYGHIVAASRVWESAPVGFVEQPNFLNAAVLLDTPLSARDLREAAIAQIERKLERARDPANPNAPRTIDIDIVLFDRDVLTVGRRRIPDPELLERAFVAVPLAELDPDYVHPEVERSLDEIARELEALQPHMLPRPDVDLKKGVRNLFRPFSVRSIESGHPPVSE